MRDRAMGARSTIQTLTLLFGVVFILVGILGFIPGITTHYSDLSFAGSDSGAKLLGVFQVSILHNFVHILFGLVGLAAARSFDSSRLYMIGGGIIYLALFLLGIVGGGDWIPADTADHWLHLGLGVVMVGIGYVLGRDRLTERVAPA
jgi:uncharacterized protein DUF4383